jgi:two-component system OmpR family sensor kinase
MASTRVKLTFAYSAALVSSVVVLSAALYVARQLSADREVAERAVNHAQLALRVLRQARAAGDTIVITSDSLVGPEIAPRIRTLLDAIPGQLMVRDEKDWPVYFSPAVRIMMPEDVIVMKDGADSLRGRDDAARVVVKNDELLIVRREEPVAGRPGNWTVIAGISRRSSTPARELLGALLIVAPIIIGVSIGCAYVIAGRALEPLNKIINDVEAITDGRSLHRRLAVETTGDELARLGTTLNAMIGRLETSFGGLRRFTADASHELKTPLTVLRADVERAMHASSSPSEQLIALEEALHETTRMADLVDSLLTLARADEGRFDLHLEPVDLAALARDVLETANILGEEAGITVTMPTTEPAHVMGDLTRLRHLLLNLVTNAIKYTPRGGRVELTLMQSDDTVSFSVRDTGIGISAADLPHIFERFWRADRVRSRASERGGFGLGLAISQWIAQAHGGTLTVQSRLHRGSTFTVTLPLPQAHDETTPSVVAEPARETPQLDPKLAAS